MHNGNDGSSLILPELDWNLAETGGSTLLEAIPSAGANEGRVSLVLQAISSAFRCGTIAEISYKIGSVFSLKADKASRISSRT